MERAIPFFRPKAGEPAIDPLVVRASRGDREAFGTLYERYARMIHGVLLARVPPAEVDDLMQQVFLAALRQLDQLRDPQAFAGWLAMIARHIATDYHRQARPTVPLADEMKCQPAPSPEAFAVLDTLKALPECYRETLLLRLVEGMTGPEIAAQTGLTPDSVRVNLHRGMKLLRERLEGKRLP